jgi:hypothetical protein
MQSEQQTTTTAAAKKTSGGKKKSTKVIEQTNDAKIEQIIQNAGASVKTEAVKPEVPTVDEVKPSAEPPLVLQDNTSNIEINQVIDYINNTSDKLNNEYSKFFKENSFTKDDRLKVEATFKKFSKATNSFQQLYYDYLSKQVNVLEKNSSNKAGGKKKTIDAGKSAIHKKHQVHPFLLKFMKLDQGSLVSRSDALSAITGYVKQEKLTNPNIIVENDKMKFKLIGELKLLFDGIEGVMNTKNLLNGEKMPTEIKYTQIMQYMTHCFIKVDSVVLN